MLDEFLGYCNAKARALMKTSIEHPEPKRLLFHVESLLGGGHAQRTAAIARACVDQGFDVMVASGRRPGDEHLRWLALPQLGIRGQDFSTLVDESGQAADEKLLAGRRRRLLTAASEFRPQAIVIDTWPFGRRRFSFELEPLAQWARSASPPAQVVCSLRDIPQPKGKARRIEEIFDRLRRYCDHVLIHGSPEADLLSLAFPAILHLDRANSGPSRHWSGYVMAAQGHGLWQEGPQVLVSGGGGGVSLKLLRTAIAARPLSSLAEADWLLLVGPRLAQADFADLCRQAPAGVRVERNRSDFPALLSKCRLSISQAGYNTVCDLLATGAPAVLVPYSEGEEVEQTLRAAWMERSGRALAVAEKELSAETLATALERAQRLRPQPLAPSHLRGAEQSALLLAQWIERRPS